MSQRLDYKFFLLIRTIRHAWIFAFRLIIRFADRQSQLSFRLRDVERRHFYLISFLDILLYIVVRALRFTRGRFLVG